MWYQIICYLILFNYFFKKIPQIKNTYFYISCLENKYLCMDTDHLHFKENTYSFIKYQHYMSPNLTCILSNQFFLN